jgi:hypothetical protein
MEKRLGGLPNGALEYRTVFLLAYILGFFDITIFFVMNLFL